MKRFVLFFLCMSCFLVNVSAKTSFRKGDTLYVSVKTSELKSSSGRFSSKVADVNYGDCVTVLESDDKSTQVKLANGTSGWISTGSLTKKKIVKSNGSNVKASTKEIALAGKGFSAESEKAYRADNSKLDYSKVDAMEKISVSEKDLKNFVKDGQLNDGGSK